MNKLRKILLFIITLLALHFILLWLFNDYTKKNSVLLRQQMSYDALKVAPKFLFVGDSHVMRSINQSDINGSFKICHYGEGPILTYFRIKHILENNTKKPSYIFVQADISRYSENFLKYAENLFFYSDYIDYNELLENDIINVEEYFKYFAYEYFPYIEFRTLLKKNQKAKIAKDKLALKDIPKDYRQIRANSFVQNKLLNFDCSKLYYPAALHYLEKTIKLCNKHDVQLIAVKYPVTDYYFKSIILMCGQAIIEYPEQDSIFHHYGIPIWDFETIFANRYDLFFDSHHMNQKGRYTFTPIIKKHILNLVNSGEL